MFNSEASFRMWDTLDSWLIRSHGPARIRPFYLMRSTGFTSSGQVRPFSPDVGDVVTPLPGLVNVYSLILKPWPIESSLIYLLKIVIFHSYAHAFQMVAENKGRWFLWSFFTPKLCGPFAGEFPSHLHSDHLVWGPLLVLNLLYSGREKDRKR